MNYNDAQKVIDNPQNYITTDSMGMKSVNWDNSAPTRSSYVTVRFIEK